MDFTQRANTRELLDEDDIPFADIRKNMEELEVINTWLGGHVITVAGFKSMLGERKSIHVCEVGCGGGDNLKAIANWCAKKGIQVQLTGIDIKDTCVDYAHINLNGYEVNLITSDYRDVQFNEKPDIIFSSLFCHHFSNEEIVKMLHWKKEQSTVGFFINDLQRHPLAYHSIRLITKWLSSSYLVQNDAPISVTRGFSRADWKKIVSSAALQGSSGIHWRWAFRWLILHRS
jgi:2-polyprenyl-3-methyl-5-hydroxy-6-metoxy-1,4-benzoquinol methylase